MDKSPLLVLFILLFVGCGSVPQTNVIGVTELTQIVVVGDDLIGSELYVDGDLKLEITKASLDKFKYGIFGVKNSTRENQQSITMEEYPGMHTVQLARSGVVVFEKSVYLSLGQTKELFVGDK